MKIEKMSRSPLDWEIYLWSGKNLHIGIYPLHWWWACICFASVEMFERYHEMEWMDIDGEISNVPCRHYQLGPIFIDVMDPR